jgi:Enolase C-terminal domain-like
VPFSAYLFYKWAGHPGTDSEDAWSEALDPGGIVAQATRMIDRYGFTAIKLKGGVFPPEQEVAAARALKSAFPDHPLRLDPNAAWTPETSLWIARELDGVLEYLEDPTPGIEGMAEVARHASMPLATNMCVVAFSHLAPAVRNDAVQVILSDHHYWGGLRRSALLAGTCDTFGIGLSMHSNSHLGISLAAMVHLAAATPNLTYACDTHWPWKAEDVVAGEPLTFSGGSVKVPDGPGLGVELDRDALTRLHEQYLSCGIRNRDDTGYMRRFAPDYERRQPRWLGRNLGLGTGSRSRGEGDRDRQRGTVEGGVVVDVGGTALGQQATQLLVALLGRPQDPGREVLQHERCRNSGRQAIRANHSAGSASSPAGDVCAWDDIAGRGVDDPAVLIRNDIAGIVEGKTGNRPCTVSDSR